jgi:hypothetical protein
MLWVVASRETQYRCEGSRVFTIVVVETKKIYHKQVGTQAKHFYEIACKVLMIENIPMDSNPTEQISFIGKF